MKTRKSQANSLMTDVQIAPTDRKRMADDLLAANAITLDMHAVILQGSAAHISHERAGSVVDSNDASRAERGTVGARGIW